MKILLVVPYLNSPLLLDMTAIECIVVHSRKQLCVSITHAGMPKKTISSNHTPVKP